MDVIEVDGSEEEDLEEEIQHEDDFYDSPSENEGKYVRKKGCVESDSEDELLVSLKA